MTVAIQTFGVPGVQMAVSAFDDNVERMGAYQTHIRNRFPCVRMVLFSELCPCRCGYAA